MVVGDAKVGKTCVRKSFDNNERQSLFEYKPGDFDTTSDALPLAGAWLTCCCLGLLSRLSPCAAAWAT